MQKISKISLCIFLNYQILPVLKDKFLRKIVTKNLYILDEVKELVEDFYNKISNENAINYEPTNTNLGDEISIKNDMNKETAIKMFNKQGFDISNYCTFASINNTGACYWANPSYDVLKNDWTFILNDQHKKVLTLLHIPANTFNNNDFIVKKVMVMILDLI